MVMVEREISLSQIVHVRLFGCASDELLSAVPDVWTPALSARLCDVLHHHFPVRQTFLLFSSRHGNTKC